MTDAYLERQRETVGAIRATYSVEELELCELLRVCLLTRVEIPAYLDAWMMGDRYGVVVASQHRTGTNVVLMDKSKRRLRVVADDCTYM